MLIALRPAGVIAALLLCIAVARAGPGDNRTLASLAPAQSFLALSIDDWPRARAAFDASPLGHLWKEPSVKEFVKALVAGAAESIDPRGGDWFAEQLRDLGLEADDLREPTGAAGVALFLTPADAAAEKPRHALHLLAVADFGEGAPAMADAIERAIRTGVVKGKARADQEQYEGQSIHVLRPAAGDEAPDEEPSDPAPWDMSGITTLRIVRVGPVIALSTSKPTIEATIDRLLGLGGKESDTLGGTRAYQDALSQHHRDAHGTLVFVPTDSFRSSLARKPDPDAGGFDVDPMAILDALGLSSIKSVGVALRLDAEHGAVEQSVGIVAPEKTGLLSMLDASMRAFEPPPFVGSDAASISVLAVRFDRLVPTLRAVLQAMPEAIRAMAGEQFDAAEKAITPVINTLDNEVSILTTYKRPLGPTSERYVVAVRLKDPLALANLLTGFAPAVGMEPRDFQGNQIYESPADAGGVSLGIGAGYAFAASHVEDIENALRLASEPASPRLASSDRFRAAAANLPPDAAGYMFSSIAESMAWMYWTVENADKIHEDMLKDLDLDDEDRRDAMAAFAREQPAWMKRLPPLAVLLRHLGDTVMDLRATPDGFRARSLMLQPPRQ
jgi:hypothetical protein